MTTKTSIDGATKDAYFQALAGGIIGSMREEAGLPPLQAQPGKPQVTTEAPKPGVSRDSSPAPTATPPQPVTAPVPSQTQEKEGDRKTPQTVPYERFAELSHGARELREQIAEQRREIDELRATMAQAAERQQPATEDVDVDSPLVSSQTTRSGSARDLVASVDELVSRKMAPLQKALARQQLERDAQALVGRPFTPEQMAAVVDLSERYRGMSVAEALTLAKSGNPALFPEANPHLPGAQHFSSTPRSTTQEDKGKEQQVRDREILSDPRANPAESRAAAKRYFLEKARRHVSG